MNDLDSSDAPMSVDKSRSFKGAFKVYTVVCRVVYSIPYIACHDAYVSYRKDIADLRKSDQFLGSRRWCLSRAHGDNPPARK